MPNPFFRFKQFTIYQDHCAMKVTTDGCLFGAWVAVQITRLNGTTALDIGAGTGLLSLIVAQQNKWHIDAVELNEAAALQAGENCASAPWQYLAVHHSDINHFFPNRQYDAIFSNPPFYEKEWQPNDVSRNLAHHGTGLKLEELLENIVRLLRPGGDVFLLLPAKRELETDRLFLGARLHIHRKVRVYPTPARKPFRLMVHVSSKPAIPLAGEELLIKDANDKYTPEFVRLLQPYYLHL